jgi:hypothetical protein
MNQKNAVPEIELSGQKKEEEKKKSGFGWWFNAGKSGSALVRGGAAAGGRAGGFVGFLGSTAGKTVITLLLTAMGSGAFVAGRLMRPDGSQFLNGRRHRVGADKANYGDVSGLPSYPKSPKDSLGYVAGGSDIYGRPNDGSAADAGKAGEPGSASDAGKAGDAGAPGAMGAPADKAGQDADAIARAMAAANAAKGGGEQGSGGNKRGFVNKIGQLSGAPSAGGGGGGSMAAAPSGSASSDKRHGQLSAFSNPGRAGTAGANSRPSAGKKGGRNALGDLAYAARQSGAAATATTAEAQKNLATDAMQGGSQGGAITGLGAGTSGNGITPETGRGTEMGAGGPTPTSSPGTGGTGNQTIKKSDCDVMSQDVGQELVSNESGGCVPDPIGKNVTPWQQLSDAAMMLMMAAGVVLLLAELFGMLYKNGAVWAYMIAQVCAYAAAVLGAVCALIGMMVMGQGQMMQGLIYTVSGAFIGYTGWKLAQGLKEQHDMQQHLANDPNAKGATEALQKDAVSKNIHWDGKNYTNGTNNFTIQNGQWAQTAPPTTPTPPTTVPPPTK